MTEIKRDSHRIIYPSSIDRGLIYLLNMWPEIIKAVPDATLHIFYGMEVWEMMHKNNPYKQIWKKKLFELMTQKGITYHGKVGHRQLEEEIQKSGVWAYPTQFPEISCITAMKMQIYGAIPVVTNFAALKETVRNGYKVDCDITTEEGQKEYLKALIRMLTHGEIQDEIRPSMQKWAREKFGWDKVASQWSKQLKEGLGVK